MQDFKKLKVWEKSHSLTVDIYRSTRGFPREELYGLTSQMRRASASIAANIAEGCGRGGKIELGRFLQMAMGSASELEYHLLLASELNLLPHTDYQRLNIGVIELKRMLASFIGKLKAEQQR
jgi:four helix bundle protein